MAHDKPSNKRAPYPKPLVIDLLPDDPQWDEEGLLPADKALMPLPIVIPPWDYFPQTNYLTVLKVYWGENQSIYEKAWLGQDYPTLPPEDLLTQVPQGLLIPGNHRVRYEVKKWDGNTDDSFPQTITIDLTPPILGADQGRLQFDTTQITRDYLDQHGDKVEGTILSYGGGKPGDVVTWYWNEDPFNVIGADIVSTRTLSRAEIGKPVVLSFPGTMIRGRGDGVWYAFYRLFDRAGNVSAYSQAVRLDVSAQPAIRYLPSPTVVEASGSATSSTLDPTDARAGATVLIPQDAAYAPNDVVSVQWATPGTEGAFKATVPDATGKRFSIPADNIVQHMGKKIPVYYQIETPPAQESIRHELTVVVTASGNWRTIQCTRPQGVVNRLSLASVQSYATFRLDRWMFMAAGQRLTVTLSGVGKSKVILDDYPVADGDITAGGVDVDVQKAVLQDFDVNGPLNVLVKVSFPGVAEPADFPSLKLTLVA